MKLKGKEDFKEGRATHRTESESTVETCFSGQYHVQLFTTTYTLALRANHDDDSPDPQLLSLRVQIV